MGEDWPDARTVGLTAQPASAFPPPPCPPFPPPPCPPVVPAVPPPAPAVPPVLFPEFPQAIKAKPATAPKTPVQPTRFFIFSSSIRRRASRQPLQRGRHMQR